MIKRTQGYGGNSGMIGHSDRRIVRTRNELAQALVALTLEKDYDAITIREITERASIGYATFFRHYPDKDALLLDVLELVLDELITLLHPRGDFDDAAHEGALLFRYVQEHAELCRVFLKSRGSQLLLERVRDAGVRSALASNRIRADAAVPPDVAAHHLVVASLGLIQWWLEHDMPYSPERMGMIYAELIVRPTHALAFES
jgi:AcrR family transcriptional regulator